MPKKAKKLTKATMPKKKVATSKKKAVATKKTTKYGKGAGKEVEKEMSKFKKGEAVSGPKLKKVESKEQAVAIGLSKAKKKGIKVPQKAKASSKKIKTTSKKK